MSYIQVTTLSELEPEEPRRVQVGDTPVVLVRIGDEVFAVSDTCTHEDEQLSGGFVEDRCIECPRHGAQFDLHTGEALTLPAVKPIQTYPVRIEGEAVSVAVDTPLAEAAAR